MDKAAIHRLILDKLAHDVDVIRRAAQTAYETATHQENIAENKYDTLGLEASYLATGQARRVEEIKQAFKRCEDMPLRAYDDPLGIQLSALVTLEAENGTAQHLFLGPDGAGLKVLWEGQAVTLITPQSPLGAGLMGKHEGDEVQINVAGVRQTYCITQVQ